MGPKMGPRMGPKMGSATGGLSPGPRTLRLRPATRSSAPETSDRRSAEPTVLAPRRAGQAVAGVAVRDGLRIENREGRTQAGPESQSVPEGSEQLAGIETSGPTDRGASEAGSPAAGRCLTATSSCPVAVFKQGTSHFLLGHMDAASGFSMEITEVELGPDHSAPHPPAPLVRNASEARDVTKGAAEAVPRRPRRVEKRARGVRRGPRVR